MQHGDNPVKVEIVYERDRCIHVKSTMAECSLCAQSCPNGAISFSAPGSAASPAAAGSAALGPAAGSPSFDADMCLHCGTCLASCPHMAFVATNFSDRKIVGRVAAQDPLLLRCFVPYGEIGYLASDTTSYKIGTCLAALTPGTLFEIAHSKQCILATDHCEACSLFCTAGVSLASNIKAARNLLGDWHRAGNLTESTPLFLADSAQSSGLEISEAPAAPQERLSRKSPDASALTSEIEKQESAGFDIVASVHKLFAKKKSLKHASPSSKGNIKTKSIKQHDVTWRHSLRALWKSASVEQTNGACYKWPVHMVDTSACMLCGTCIRMCPTGAIQHSFQGNSYTQRFTPGLCVDCMLCTMSCLQHAISRGYQTNPTPFDEVLCCTEEAKKCIKCGNPIPQHYQMAGYCRQCAIELRIDTEVVKQDGDSAATNQGRSNETAKQGGRDQ